LRVTSEGKEKAENIRFAEGRERGLDIRNQMVRILEMGWKRVGLLDSLGVNSHESAELKRPSFPLVVVGDRIINLPSIEKVLKGAGRRLRRRWLS